MKLEIETPSASDRRQRSGPRQDRGDARRRAAHRRARPQHRPRRRSTRTPRLRCARRARCSRARRVSCATRPPRPATCSSGHAAPISTTPISRATNGSLAAGAPRSTASAGSMPSSARARPASPPIRATWRWPCARSTRRSKRCVRTARRGRFRSPSSTGCRARRRMWRRRSSRAS